MASRLSLLLLCTILLVSFNEEHCYAHEETVSDRSLPTLSGGADEDHSSETIVEVAITVPDVSLSNQPSQEIIVTNAPPLLPLNSMLKRLVNIGLGYSDPCISENPQSNSIESSSGESATVTTANRWKRKLSLGASARSLGVSSYISGGSDDIESLVFEADTWLSDRTIPPST